MPVAYGQINSFIAYKDNHRNYCKTAEHPFLLSFLVGNLTQAKQEAAGKSRNHYKQTLIRRHDSFVNDEKPMTPKGFYIDLPNSILDLVFEQLEVCGAVKSTRLFLFKKITNYFYCH